MNNLNSFSNSSLQDQWQRDLSLRKRVPINENWRGCLGLIMMLDNPDDTSYHGDLGLVRNDQVRWMVLRDVPPGHFPGNELMDVRGANLVSTTSARLRHGMPVIDFRAETRKNWDFRRMPHSERLRRYGIREHDVEVAVPSLHTLDSGHYVEEFEALNRASSAMTHFAFCAVDETGKPVRAPWAQRRPNGRYRTLLPADPSSWMPRPYLSVPKSEVERLYWAATETQGEIVFPCAVCGRNSPLSTFRNNRLCNVSLFETGDFIATCVHCRKRHKWFLDDGESRRSERRFPAAFREGFCGALTEGLPLRTVQPEVYCGIVVPRNNQDPDVIRHRFKSLIDGSIRDVLLLNTARILVRMDHPIEAGQVWAQALPARSSSGLPPKEQWSRLSDICGGSQHVGRMQQTWFAHQAVRLPCDSERVLFPAELISIAAGKFQSAQLWWDLTPAMPYYNWESQAAAFPPLRTKAWNALHIVLPGDVVLDGSIVDPRCDENHSLENHLRECAADHLLLSS